MLTFNLIRITSIFRFFLESSPPINLPLLVVWLSYISMVIKLQQHSLISVSYSNFALILGAVSFLGDSTFQLPCKGCMYIYFSVFFSKFWNELETIFIHDHISAVFFFSYFDYYFRFFILESSAFEMFWFRTNIFSFFCYSIPISRRYQRRNVVWRPIKCGCTNS